MRLIDHSNTTRTFLQIHLGGDRNWVYMLADPAGKACVFDCGHEPQALADIARDRGLSIETIAITHGHGDHTAGVAELASLTGATVVSGSPASVAGSRVLTDGEVLEVGALSIEALLTPGHSPDHVCYRCDDVLVTGDLLFCGKVGGTGDYFPGSSATEEWASLHRVLALPDTVGVFPGHDYYGGEGEMPHSTIGHERRHNPFLLCQDLKAFEDLKTNWGTYKKEHGIR